MDSILLLQHIPPFTNLLRPPHRTYINHFYFDISIYINGQKKDTHYLFQIIQYSINVFVHNSNADCRKTKLIYKIRDSYKKTTLQPIVKHVGLVI